MDSEDQPAASQISEMDTPLVTLVERALTPMGHCKPNEVYARVIASTNHLEILCFVTGLLRNRARLPKLTKSCSDLLYEAEHSMNTLRALTGQGPDGAEQGQFLVTRRRGKHRKRYNLGSE